MKPSQCIRCGIKENKINELYLHQFPSKGSARRRKWLDILGIDRKVGKRNDLRLCSNHFGPESFERKAIKKDDGNYVYVRTALKSTSLPVTSASTLHKVCSAKQPRTSIFSRLNSYNPRSFHSNSWSPDFDGIEDTSKGETPRCSGYLENSFNENDVRLTVSQLIDNVIDEQNKISYPDHILMMLKETSIRDDLMQLDETNLSSEALQVDDGSSNSSDGSISTNSCGKQKLIETVLKDSGIDSNSFDDDLPSISKKKSYLTVIMSSSEICQKKDSKLQNIIEKNNQSDIFNHNRKVLKKKGVKNKRKSEQLSNTKRRKSSRNNKTQQKTKNCFCQCTCSGRRTEQLKVNSKVDDEIQFSDDDLDPENSERYQTSENKSEVTDSFSDNSFSISHGLGNQELTAEENKLQYIDAQKSIIYNSKLLELFHKCFKSNCEASISPGDITVTSTYLGSGVRIFTKCFKGHEHTWDSQLTLKRKAPALNSLIPVALLVTGNSFQHWNEIAKVLNISSVGHTTFYKRQADQVLPAIEEIWKEHINPIRSIEFICMSKLE